MARKGLLKDLKAVRQQKKTKHQHITPVTADDFLAAGVDLEEAGEKWRVGDPVKGMRFYARAIEMYDQGLQRHPQDFDLAYNKARAQYEITQHPKLARSLQVPLSDALITSLASHRAALALKQDNIDVVFNTAQVLTSLAEALSGTPMRDIAQHQSSLSAWHGTAASSQTDGVSEALSQLAQAIKCLLEALDLFQRCATLQEFQVSQNEEDAREVTRLLEEQSREDRAADSTHTKGLSGSHHPAPAPAPESDITQWATIVEPITYDSLVETAIAQLHTLSILCNCLAASVTDGHPQLPELSWVEQYSSILLTQKLPAYAATASDVRICELATARATFACTFAELCYRLGRIDLKTYRHDVQTAFEEPGETAAQTAFLIARADAWTAFSAAIGEVSRPAHDVALASDQQGAADPCGQPITQQGQGVPALQWQALSNALSSLAAAAKSTEADKSLATRIYIARGDAELLRHRLGAPPSCYQPAAAHATLLLNNAQTYFRGAAALARNSVLHGVLDAQGSLNEAVGKEAIVAAAVGDLAKAQDYLRHDRPRLTRVAQELVEDDLMEADLVKRLWTSIDPATAVVVE